MKFKSTDELAVFFWNHPYLQDLCIDESPDLRQLPRLPESLIALTVKDCRQFGRLPELPLGLLRLYVSNCLVLESLNPAQDSIPRVWGETKHALPVLPGALQMLTLRHCGIKNLPPLPEGMYGFSLEDCPNLETVPRLPASLKSLEIFNCPKLSLQNLRVGSLRINIR